LERALDLFQPGRDDDLAFRFGHDAGVAAMALLAIASWPMGEVDGAISLIDRMQTRFADLTHVGTLAFGRMHTAMFELTRGDQARAAPNAFELARLTREHDLPMWRPFGVFLQGWATAASGAVGNGLEDMRRGAELLREQNVLFFDGLLKIAVAEAEARAGDPDRAVAILDEALATADRLGFRTFEAELHRARGEILLNRDPANPAPAEEAFQTAIAVAKQQATRSFELRAALALAKLYQSTSRPADAHAALAPALDGFSPTPEFPEIGEAQALLTALADNEEVKADAARRQRLTQLNIAYGNALFAARGYGAAEVAAAFARARELASGIEDPADRLSTYYGLWAGHLLRGELEAMHELSSAAIELLNPYPGTREASIAHRIRGTTYWYQGDFTNARDHLERALAMFDPERDGDLAFRFGHDIGVSCMAYLAPALWSLGEFGRARELEAAMIVRAREAGHVITLAFATWYRAMFEIMRLDPGAAEPYAAETWELGRAHELPMYIRYGALKCGWVRARLGDRNEGVAQMRQGLDSLRQQGDTLVRPFCSALLAELEAEVGEIDTAVGTIDRTLAEIERTGQRTFEAEAHRIRGEILFKRDPGNPAPAEEAFQTAIAVARRQGARSFALRAALSLAKLLQSNGHSTEAHAVLAPALEGFAPTPEMLEIEEALELKATIEASAQL